VISGFPVVRNHTPEGLQVVLRRDQVFIKRQGPLSEGVSGVIRDTPHCRSDFIRNLLGVMGGVS
jgi:hypothetical protein